MSCRIEKGLKKEEGGGEGGWEVMQLRREYEEEFMKCLILIHRIAAVAMRPLALVWRSRSQLRITHMAKAHTHIYYL